VSEEELAERGRTLLDVLALAEHLPYRPKPRLGYPPLRTRSGRTA
jgi:hypothetical protein